MKYREINTLNEQQTLNEIAPLVSIANWFGQKYHDVIAASSKKTGQGEIQKFVNKHLRSFMQVMGRYQVDWPTVTMYVIYQYMRLFMKLPDADIVEVVNSVILDPTVKGKRLTLQQIQDKEKTLIVGDISKIMQGQNKATVIVEKLITAAAVRQMERHWETQTRVGPAQTTTATTRTTTQQTTRTAPAASAAPGATTVATPERLTAIDAALSQLGVK